MGFQKGQSKPPGSGRKKGTKNKSSVKLEKFLIDNDINLAQEIYNTVKEVSDADKKAKLLLELYSYIDSKPKEKEVEEDPVEDSKAFEDKDTEELLKLLDGNK